MLRASLIWSVALGFVLAAGCATAGGSGDDDDDDIVVPDGGGGNADARPQGTPDARPQGTPDAPPGTPVEITLSQSTATTITGGNSVACVSQDALMNPLYHREGGYYRVFQLSSFGVTSAFNVSKVTVGIETATAETGGSQPANVKLYTLSGALSLANLTQIGTAPTSVTDTTTGVLIDVPVTGTAPAGSTLVVEFQTPDGVGADPALAANLIFPGSNALGQTGPTYLRAPDCGAAEPSDVAGLGFPDMHFVLTVTGTHTP